MHTYLLGDVHASPEEEGERAIELEGAWGPGLDLSQGLLITDIGHDAQGDELWIEGGEGGNINLGDCDSDLRITLKCNCNLKVMVIR